MPDQPAQMPALGIPTLSDYLGANRDVLDAGFRQDSATAHQTGDTLNQQLSLVQQSAQDFASSHGAAAKPEDVPDYQNAWDSSIHAQEQGRKYGSQYGLAGSGANPVSGPDSFNAALEYGAHGGDYKMLSDFLGGMSTPESALAKGNAAGLAPKPPESPPPVPEDRNPRRGSGTYDHPGGSEDAPWDNPNPWGQDGGG